MSNVSHYNKAKHSICSKELKKAAESLHQEERSGSKGRKFRKNVKSVEKVKQYW